MRFVLRDAAGVGAGGGGAVAAFRVFPMGATGKKPNLPFFSRAGSYREYTKRGWECGKKGDRSPRSFGGADAWARGGWLQAGYVDVVVGVGSIYALA